MGRAAYIKLFPAICLQLKQLITKKCWMVNFKMEKKRWELSMTAYFNSTIRNAAWFYKVKFAIASQFYNSNILRKPQKFETISPTFLNLLSNVK